MHIYSFKASLFMVFLQFASMVTSSDKGYKYEVYIFNKPETRTSNLSCFECHNGDNTDCIGMSDIHKIPTRKCFINEPYCKVRRLSTDGELTTFDRYCAKECTPGCREGGLYSECVSCCNHRSFCNMDNFAQTSHPKTSPFSTFLSIVLFAVSLNVLKKITCT
ncbi:structural maintenance of chromosomes protein 1A [Elysia marginata]|uniref:Structural maintenance of chromosomes protein 1A n=1 Tax=Elysia marginata TaxID=1093978 RepID=A0AAV4H8I7_9GAST|nr:structural maintenance of chromosomes protein 1A [Elysia marginata]